MATQPTAGVQEGRHLLDYIRVLLKRLWLIVGVFVVVVGVVGYATWRAVPQYRATAVINIRQPSMILGRLDPTNILHTLSQGQVYMNTQYALLKQRMTVERMVRDKGAKDWENPETEELWFEGMSEKEIANSIVGSIEVRPEKETTLVRVTVSGTERLLVAEIANALVETFAEMQAEAHKSSIESTIMTIEKEMLRYQSQANDSNNDITKLLEEHNTDRETLLDRIEFLRGRARNALEEVDGRVVELAQKKPTYEKLRKVLEDGNGHAIAWDFQHPLFSDDGNIQQLENEVALKVRELQKLLQEFGERSERIQTLRGEIEAKQTLLASRKRRKLESWMREFEELVLSRDLLQEHLDGVEQMFRQLSGVKREFDEKSSVVQRQQREADRYAALWEKLQAGRSQDWEPVSIAQVASRPFAPFKPDKQLNMILAIVIGLLGGIGLSFFLEYMDDTVKTKEELQKVTSVPLFGVIPNITARRSEITKKDLYAYTQPKSTISEAFRGIRTALSYSSQKRENQVYLVTSAGPKEGKTTIAINVATVMAYSGTRTLLVDADLRKPRLHKSFEVNNTRGLTNLIIQDAKFEDVVIPSSVENLDVLPSGPIPPNPSELLGRDRMTELLDELRSRYDRILLDTPPIGAVTDAAVLGRIVDSVIVVVHAGKTRKKLIERGLEQLAQIDVDVSGIVLNNLKIGRKRYYPGYYHYYYYYSSYYGADDKRSLKSREKSRKKRS
ncbi:MAG: polysaccharide biosynthesis tyrosine autokinase [Planctomycetota bacterium]|jgi:capsular exopolysaccharide synthesis family protein